MYKYVPYAYGYFSSLYFFQSDLFVAVIAIVIEFFFRDINSHIQIFTHSREALCCLTMTSDFSQKFFKLTKLYQNREFQGQFQE